MLIKVLKNLLLILGILFLQLAVVPNLPGIFSQLNLILVSVIFISVVYHFYLGTIYAFFWGFILDLYSFFPFGTMLICLLLTSYAVYRIFEKFLTNKSFYTILGLTVIGTIVFNALIFIYNLGSYFIQTAQWDIFNNQILNLIINLGPHLAMNLGLAALLFFIFNFTSRRFKAVFIDTTKN